MEDGGVGQRENDEGRETEGLISQARSLLVSISLFNFSQAIL